MNYYGSESEEEEESVGFNDLTNPFTHGFSNMARLRELLLRVGRDNNLNVQLAGDEESNSRDEEQINNDDEEQINNDDEEEESNKIEVDSDGWPTLEEKDKEKEMEKEIEEDIEDEEEEEH